MKIKEKHKATIFLVFLAPFIGEGLSGSTPMIEFLNPINLVLLLFLYGFGALIIRELTFRWNNGSINWNVILILGLAYGIIEEGWFLLSFFNPNWIDLGVLGTYGRSFGINWMWAMYLSLFHALFSIILPILFTTLNFRKVENKEWLSNKQLVIIMIIFFCCGPIWILFVISNYSYLPGLEEYLFFVGLALLLILGANKLSKIKPKKSRFKISLSNGYVWLLTGGAFSFFFFLIIFISEELSFSFFIPFTLQPLGTFLFTQVWFKNINKNDDNLNYKTILPCVIGVVSFLFILLLSNFLNFIIVIFLTVILFLRTYIINTKQSG